ncbi:hypothetical protein F5884DRAFT_421717 [Xylogone sp. PMI_703]|nr:hypothetical protein F5884DRAFT_421717 [Xylogone sp. PMI_703]
MPSHLHLHRRHARASFPDPFAMAEAAASAISNAFGRDDGSQDDQPDPEPTHKAPKTKVSVVYYTVSPTFDGPVAGYSTASNDEPKPTVAPPHTTTSVHTTAPTHKAESSKDSSSEKPKAAPTTSTHQTLTTHTTHKTELPSSIVAPSSSVALSLPLVAAAPTTTGLAIDTASPTAQSDQSSSSATTSASKGGMSAGGKAGLAIGIVLIVGVILGLCFFFVKRRKNAQSAQRLDDEKSDAFAAGTAAPAPQRSLNTQPPAASRPVTQPAQFGPAAGAAVAAGSQARGNTSPTSAQDNRENPFGNHAETIDAANATGPSMVQGMGPGGAVLAGTAAAGAAVGLARSQSKSGNGPKPMDLTKKGPFMGPPSPAITEYSVSEAPGAAPPPSNTAAAIAAAGGPANSAVHRVQLDFKPSMEDELELQAGQLIRLLHEYDDGWALCIRLDRSQQGVVPRTCLSVRPVKPRPPQNGPRGPPPPGMRPGPQGRPMSPANQGPRPMSPAQARPMSPAQARPMSPAMKQGPRPMSPAQNGPVTPTNQGRPASPAQQQARRLTPPGPSAMNPAQQPSQQPTQQSTQQPTQQPAQQPTQQTAQQPVQQPAQQPSQPSPPSQPSNGVPPELRTPVGRKPVPGQAL